jgi:outer membrane protein OmpA-like peptidoglycan-associated protein
MKLWILVTAAIAVVAPAVAHAQTSAAPQCPDNFAAYADTTEPVKCACTAEATAEEAGVWGMDVYTGDSAVCRAALHAGVIAKSGGAVTVIPEAGRKAYPGVTRNGVSSSNHGDFRSSFRFATAAAAPAGAAARPATVSVASICPDNFAAYADTTEPVTCSCTADAIAEGGVWGMDVYTGDSAVCRAALHAGVVGKSGGPVTVVPEAGRKAYPGVTRNGVSSSNHGDFRSSFRFAAAVPAPVGAATAAAPPQVRMVSTASDCPDNFAAYADTTAQLMCACTADATAEGGVWGMDVYTGDSAVCRAALHAGVVGKSGGTVTVVPEAGRQAYPGVTRNGVSSSNHGSSRSSFRFAAPARAVMIDNKPAQQPIAASIKATGQVQLYIQFRFNSADLDVDAAPTLMELRDALNAAPDLRLTLIGHTDSIGTPHYNRTLSHRRAQAVVAWLVAKGVPAARLAVDGRGPDQPIADNATDEGRALNRRVQALRAYL